MIVVNRGNRRKMTGRLFPARVREREREREREKVASGGGKGKQTVIFMAF